MNHQCTKKILVPSRYSILLTILLLAFCFAQTLPAQEQSYVDLGVVLLIQPPELAGVEDSPPPQWTGPGTLMLHADGRFSMVQQAGGDAGEIADSGRFGITNNRLYLYPDNYGEGVDWVYGLYTYDNPSRYALRLVYKPKAGFPPEEFQDTLNFHLFAESQPLDLDGNGLLWPLAWSRNGILLYLIKEYEWSGRAAAVFTLGLFDAVEDAMLVSEILIPEDEEAFLQSGNEDDPHAWWLGENRIYTYTWSRLADTAAALMAENRLIQDSIQTGRGETLQSGSERFNFSVILDPPVTTGETAPLSRSMTVMASSDKSGKKTVANQSDLPLAGARVLASIKSPFEQRVVILVGMDTWVEDWEAVPSWFMSGDGEAGDDGEADASGSDAPGAYEPVWARAPSFGLFGCNLRVGFRK